MRLGSTYSNERLEAASKRAVELGACSYQSLKSILIRSIDRQTALPLERETVSSTTQRKKHVKSTDD